MTRLVSAWTRLLLPGPLALILIAGHLVLPASNAALASVIDAPLPKTLRYLGRFEEQAGPDHQLGVALVGADHLASVSPTGLTLIERGALHSGTVEDFVAHYEIENLQESNLDGAPVGDTHYDPKFFQLSIRLPYAYVATRYDGLWVMELEEVGGVWSIEERNRLLVPREFTEATHIVDDLLFVAHHADGVEVLDLDSDPVSPPTLDRLTDPLVDAWGIWAESDGTVWVADGAGGVKMLSLAGGVLSFVTGEDPDTSPGVVLDVAVTGGWVLAAVGGQGVAVYDRLSGERQGLYPLPGECVDIEPIAADGAVLACRTWTNVVSVTPAGEIVHEAKARMMRRLEEDDNSTHLASRVAVDGRHVYVAGWDHLDAFFLEAASSSDQPAIGLSSQRAQFAMDGAPIEIIVDNGGGGLLDVTEISSSHPAIEVTPNSTILGRDESTLLTVTWNGVTEGAKALVDLVSNDPGDPTLRLLAYSPKESRVDPGDTAIDFSGTAIRRNYETAEVTEKEITLSTFSRQGRVVYFLVFGTW